MMYPPASNPPEFQLFPGSCVPFGAEYKIPEVVVSPNGPQVPPWSAWEMALPAMKATAMRRRGGKAMVEEDLKGINQWP